MADVARAAVHDDRGGATLVEALAALALVAFAAIAVVTLAHGSIHALRHTAQVDRARLAAREIAREIESWPWHALPHRLGGAPGDRSVSLDSDGGSLLPEWSPLVESLRGGSLRVDLEALSTGGGSSTFVAAVALRARITVRYGTSSDDDRVIALEVLRP